MKKASDIEFSEGYRAALGWFEKNGWTPFAFQEETWQQYLAGKDGLLNAPTGSGKTYALWLPVLADWINRNPDFRKKTKNGLRLLWITPLRALTNDIRNALQRAAWEMDVPWLIKVRTGDTTTAEKQRFRKSPPEVLITTPESLHVMLAQKGYADFFKNLEAVVIDEWHELLGSKRGVQVELGLSRLRALRPGFRTWGISATIGNLEQALDVLLGSHRTRSVIVRAEIEKSIQVRSIIPNEIERFPWAGHLGLKLIPAIIPILENSSSTLIFINTRGQTEVWYRKLLEYYPDLAGTVALHHGSLDREIRTWVEESIHNGRLKVVLCTSSLDLGVDFAPVETVIQVGSPKAVSRFLQRAGRSGHRPGAISTIYFLPTHSLELIESAGLKDAIVTKVIEDRTPMKQPIDVLLQYMVTLAVSDGFLGKELYREIKTTWAYRNLAEEDWEWLLAFITTGGNTLHQYDEYHKVDKEGDFYQVHRRMIALRHRLAIGTIVSEPMMNIKLLRGSNLGSIEEDFISRLKPGDVFWFAGRGLELIQVKEMTAYVRKSKKGGIIPSWTGARLSLSAPLAKVIRKKLEDYRQKKIHEIEIEALEPLLALQKRWSDIPGEKQLLIEKLVTDEGFHLFFFPIGGRSIHEGLAALTAYRLSQRQPITFSIAMNDYGFELLSDEEVDIEDAVRKNLFTTDYLHEDISASLNSTEMAKRRFREIAQIGGLLFTGYPGKMKKNRHLQATSSLLFDVFKDYDPGNLLLEQAYSEVFEYQLEERQLRELLDHINRHKIKITYPKRPSPFAFPIMVDRLREKITSEKLEDRIRKMQAELDYEADENR